MMKRTLSLFLAVALGFTMLPMPAAAAEHCQHHETHTDTCGYVEAVAGSDCAHSHDGSCGYAEAVAEVPCACETTDESGALVHTEGCGYIAPVTGADCTHTHDTAVCGYVQAVEGKPCTYRCDICLDHDHGDEAADSDDIANPSASGTDPEEIATSAPDGDLLAMTEAVCTCETKCAGDALHAGCEVCAADLAACEGESAEDPAVAAVRELIAALPDAEALAAMSTEEQNAVYDALLGADEAYQALNEEQKGQLAEENAKLDALFAYFSSPKMTAPAATPTVDGCYIYANGMPITIEAGSDGKTKVSYNGTTLAEGDLSDYIIYGGSKDGTVESTSITMTGGTVNYIYGGGNGGSVTGSAAVEIRGGTVTGRVYGGGDESSVGSTEVTISNSTVDGDIVGGGYDSNVTGSATVNISGSEVHNVYGGNCNGGTVGSTEVTISNSTVKYYVIGGCQYEGKVKGNTAITITNSTVNNDVYGGGSGNETNATGSATINISGSTVNGGVYGGGRYSGTVGSAHIKYENGAQVSIALEDGIYRTASNGDFQSVTAGETTPQGYFEYLSANHYKTSAIADPEKHAIECTDGNCSLKLTGATAPHSWNVDDSCDVCGCVVYDIWVGGVQVCGVPDESGNITVTGDTISGTVTFTPASAAEDDPNTSVLENAPTLTLNGASITAAATPVDVNNNPPRGIYSKSALNLVLTGENTITASTTDYSAGVMANTMDLTISGGGSLEINTCGYGIMADSLVTDNVAIEIAGSVYAISLNTGCTIEDSTVSAVGSKQGISSLNGTIEIDNSSVYAEGESYSFYGSSEVVSVRLSGGAHVKTEGTIGTFGAALSVNYGAGYLRTGQDGEFARKEGGSLETGGISYFEYLGEGHYTFSPVAASETHAINCTDENCILKLANAAEPHSWNADTDGAACADCKVKAVASVTAGGTTAYYCGIDNAVANWTDGATLTLLADVTDLAGYITTTGKGLVLDLNGHTLASDDTDTISIEAASELTIRDSKGGGRIEGTVSASAGEYSKSALRLESGTVKKVFANGDFTMTGGSIKNEDGYGLYSNGGNNNVVISGGEIYGGETGIWLSYSSNLTITGTAEITGASEYAIYSGSGVVISGTPTISGSQCEFSLGGKITLNTQNAQPASGKTWRVEIDTAKIADGVFAIPGEGVTLEAAWFTSGMTGYVVVKDGDNLKLAKGITEGMVTLSSESFTYNGSQQNPTVTVTWRDGFVLTEGQHYAVGCKDSKGDWVSPTDAGTYTVVITGMNDYAGEVEKTYTINPQSLTGAVVTAQNQTYTGSRLTPTVTVTDVKATDYDVSYSPDTLTNAGSYTVTITGKGNFTGTTTGTFVIDPVDISNHTANSSDQITIFGRGDFTEPTIPGVASETVPGTFQYSITAANGATEVTDGDAAAVKASLATLEEDKDVVVNWTFSPTTPGNYTGTKAGSFTVTAKDIEFKVGNDAASAANAIHVRISATEYGKTWNERISLKSGSITASVGNTTVGGSYTIVPDNGALTDRPGVGTHSYTVKFTGGGYTDVTVFTGTLTVTPKPVTVTADDVIVPLGTDMNTVRQTYTVSGLCGTDTLTKAPAFSLSAVPDTSREGEYTITPGGADAGSNYTLVYKSGLLKVRGPRTITVAAAANGKVSVSHTSAIEGTQVTITATPNSGCKLSTLVVTDASGKQVAVSTDNNGKYGFTMPYSNVTVKATFASTSTGIADPTNPKTGDDFNLVLWSSMATASMLCLAALFFLQKKGKHQR